VSGQHWEKSQGFVKDSSSDSKLWQWCDLANARDTLIGDYLYDCTFSRSYRAVGCGEDAA